EGVGRTFVQPPPERGRAADGPPPPPCAQERLLDEVLAVVEGAEHPVAVHVELPAMALKQFGERGVIGDDGHVSVTAIATKTHQPIAPWAPVRLCAFRDSPSIRVSRANRYAGNSPIGPTARKHIEPHGPAVPSNPALTSDSDSPASTGAPASRARSNRSTCAGCSPL